MSEDECASADARWSELWTGAVRSDMEELARIIDNR